MELEKARRLPANPSGLMGLDRSTLRLINKFLDFSAWVNMPTHDGCATPGVRFLQNGYVYDGDYYHDDDGYYDYHTSSSLSRDDKIKMGVLQDAQQVDTFTELVGAVLLVGGDVLVQDCDGLSVVDWFFYPPRVYNNSSGQQLHQKHQ